MTLAAIFWSIAFPNRRIWPPKHYTTLTPFLVWVPTFTLFGVLILLGVWGWADLPIPSWLRFGIGLPLDPDRQHRRVDRRSHISGCRKQVGLKGSLRTEWHVSLLSKPAIYG